MILYSIISVPIVFLIFIFYPQITSKIIPNYEIGITLRLSLLFYFFIYGFEQLLIFSIFTFNHRVALKVRLIGFLTNLLLCYGFIKLGGIEYAAISICVSSLAMIILSLYIINKYLNIKKTIKAIVSMALQSILLIIFIICLKKYFFSPAFISYLKVALIFILAYFFIVIDYIKIFFKRLTGNN